MPVTKLYVEGDLDEELLASVLAGAPVVQKRGSKYVLKSIVVTERGETRNQSIEFLRDRDFDSEPDISAPHTPKPILTPRSGDRLGWSWFRHSIECYLLEPALAAKALEKPQNEIEAAIQQAGKAMVVYQAARWTLGQARAKLPPVRLLETHPPTVDGEFELPEDMSESACWSWLSTVTRVFIQPVEASFAENALQKSFGHYRTQLSGMDVPNILVWFSGKDLLAFIAPKIGSESPREVRNRLRNWVRNHPDESVDLLPEWAELKRLLSQ